MELPLQSRRVTRILLDFDLTIEFTGGATVAFSEFVIGDVLIDEDNQFEGLALATSLVERVCVSADYAESGELTLVFDDGTLVEAAQREEVESWEYTADDGATVVCLPGGEIEIFPGSGQPRTTAGPITDIPSVGATVVRIGVGRDAIVEFSDRSAMAMTVPTGEVSQVLRESVIDVAGGRVVLSSGVVIELPT